MICENCVHEGWIDLQDKREHHCKLYRCMVNPFARGCKERTIRVLKNDGKTLAYEQVAAQVKTFEDIKYGLRDGTISPLEAEKRVNPYDGYPQDGRTADQVVRDALAAKPEDPFQEEKRKRGRPRGWGMKIR